MNRGYYRKKPIQVMCEQFETHDSDGWPLGVYKDGDEFCIDTKEGTMRVKPGDWIVTGIEGERYCIDRDIFEKSYESC